MLPLPELSEWTFTSNPDCKRKVTAITKVAAIRKVVANKKVAAIRKVAANKKIAANTKAAAIRKVAANKKIAAIKKVAANKIKGFIEPTHGSVCNDVRKLQSTDVLKLHSTKADWNTK